MKPETIHFLEIF